MHNHNSQHEDEVTEVLRLSIVKNRHISDYTTSSSSVLPLNELASTNLVVAQEERGSSVVQQRPPPSAIERAPTEVWDKIFSEVLSMGGYFVTIGKDRYGDPNYDENKYQPTTPIFAPLIALSGVCSRWRDIILGTPRFWASIDIRLRKMSEFALEILELTLERSGDAPLDVRIRELEKLDEAVYPSDAVAWTVLASHLHRCHKLVVDNNMEHVLADPPYHLRDIQFTFPVLTSFSGDYEVDDQRGGSQIHAVLGAGLVQAPNLTSVSMYHPDNLFEGLPFSQLTSFTFRMLYCGGLDKVLGILPLCTRLEYLALEDPFLSDSTQPIPTYLPSVTTLVLGEADSPEPSLSPKDLDHLLLSLSLPALTKLILVFGSTRKFEWPSGLPSLLRGSADTLTTLCVEIHQYGSAEFRQPLFWPVLEDVPNLRAFNFIVIGKKPCEMAHNSRILVELFTGCLSESKEIVPKLASLSVRMTHIDLNDAIESVVRAVELRRPAKWDVVDGSPLTEIHLTHLRPPPDTSNGRFDAGSDSESDSWVDFDTDEVGTDDEGSSEDDDGSNEDSDVDFGEGSEELSVAHVCSGNALSLERKELSESAVRLIEELKHNGADITATVE